MSVDKYLINICKVLQKHSVKYLIIGGAAVAYHGYSRLTTNVAGKPVEKPDYDFWFQPDYTNYHKILNSLEELGVNVSRLKEENAVDLKRAFLRIPLTECTLDFLPQLMNLKNFNECYSKRISITIDSVDLIFIGFEDLIEEKRTGREKDINDFNELNRQSD